MPRLRAISPVRIECGVHFEPAPSAVALVEAVALFEAVEEINRDAAATPCVGRKVHSLSIVADREQEYWALHASPLLNLYRRSELISLVRSGQLHKIASFPPRLFNPWNGLLAHKIQRETTPVQERQTKK